MQRRAEFWAALDLLLAEHEIVIDRPRCSRHPRYSEMVYPLDYGYLAGTIASDGGGIDLWRGSAPELGLVGVILTVDLTKRDAEIKLVVGCTPAEIDAAVGVHNGGELTPGTRSASRGVFVARAP